ncbi:MAG: hypothetical protein ACRDS0_24165 [Pseudonocardiaceae bacterium]
MIVKVMCRIDDGQLRPGELEITQPVAPLVSWSVNTSDLPEEQRPQAIDLSVEVHLPGDTVWTGDAYQVTDIEHESPWTMLLRGTGPLRENSRTLHADVVVQRMERAMLAETQT